VARLSDRLVVRFAGCAAEERTASRGSRERHRQLGPADLDEWRGFLRERSEQTSRRRVRH